MAKLSANGTEILRVKVTETKTPAPEKGGELVATETVYSYRSNGRRMINTTFVYNPYRWEPSRSNRHATGWKQGRQFSETVRADSALLYRAVMANAVKIAEWAVANDRTVETTPEIDRAAVAQWQAERAAA